MTFSFRFLIPENVQNIVARQSEAALDYKLAANQKDLSSQFHSAERLSRPQRSSSTKISKFYKFYKFYIFFKIYKSL
jgi:hypothetical protein